MAIGWLFRRLIGVLLFELVEHVLIPALVAVVPKVLAA